MCWMALLSVAVSAQDFASRFMAEHQADSNLTCVTISPKMMEEIMKSDAEKDKETPSIAFNTPRSVLNRVPRFTTSRIFSAILSPPASYSLDQ